MNIGGWIKRQPKMTIFFMAVVLFLLDEYVDYVTGPAVNISFFHLIPIFLIVWSSGFWPGAAYSTFCAVVIEWVGVLSLGRNFTGIEFFNAAANLVFFLVFCLILDRLNKNLETITYMAEVDGLTRLLNFHSFFQKTEKLTELAARSRQSLTIVYFDVDDFKRINDTFGHREGDEVLALIGKILNSNLRKNDLRGRVGGDEFALALPGLSMKQAETTIPEIFGMLSRAMRENNRAAATFSAGAIVYPRAPLSIKNALQEADHLMYEAKMNGKNNFILRLSTGSAVPAGKSLSRAE